MSTSDRFDCAVCVQRIAKKQTHILTETDAVVCMRCLLYDSRRAHTIAYPRCPHAWHDMFDHSHTHCTLAGLRWVIRQGGYHAVIPPVPRQENGNPIPPAERQP
jgi:hypothetical protein